MGFDNDDMIVKYRNMQSKILEKLLKQIPVVNPLHKDIFCNACLNVINAKATVVAAENCYNSIPDEDKERKAFAKNSLDAAKKSLGTSMDLNVEVSILIVNSLDFDALCMLDILNLCILLDGTPEKLGTFANQSTDQASLIDNLLKDPDLSRDILLAGGAKGSQYGEAMQILRNIKNASSKIQGNDTLYRLALATSLEHATPLAEFDTPRIFVDPIQRYLHYEDAFLTGELDLNFSSFTVWEYRMIVNCDAPDDQIGWCRRMMRNYRPDEVLMDDYVWRYCLVVRTEVGYRKPQWTSIPRTYPQIVSGGGQCGPRAWFARFVCKSFGIPTWGARQPGHAMAHHWTPNGWVGVLGADWEYSFWEGRSGPDFLLETRARVIEQDYFNNVQRLNMIAMTMGEKSLDSCSGLPDPDSFWFSLALMMKHYLSREKGQKTEKKSYVHENNLIIDCKSWSSMSTTPTVKDNGVILIPAVSCSNPKSSTKSIIFMKCFMGGMQINCRDVDELEYTLPDIPKDRTYQLILRVCTVHLQQQPLLLTIHNKSDEGVTIASINVPYTIGEWQYTDPVEINLSQGMNVLCFQRQTPNFGLTIKDLTLIPEK